MAQSPIIGLNTSFTGQEVKVRYGYVKSVLQAGGKPLLIPPAEHLELIEQYSRLVDGIIFIGGKDYHPSHYGGLPQRDEELIHPFQDRFDLALARYVLEHTSLPVLGICGGMQLLAIARGGKLIQDIPSQWHPPQGEAVNHRKGMHEVKILPNSLLGHLLGSETGISIITNTSHHQAVHPGEVGNGFRASAFAADGIVEAIEPAQDSRWSRKKRFVFGVQWHPERMDSDENQKRIFTQFIEAARRS